MNSFILEGDKNQQDLYIEKFIADKKIPSYFVQTYESFKIADARALQKILSAKLPEGAFRLVVVFSPTVEAQNAILKTIEELSSSNYVFFCVSSKDELLSTIVSRSSMVQLEFVETAENADLEKRLLNIFEETGALRKKQKLELIGFLGEIEKNDIDAIVLSLRSLFKKSDGKNYRKDIFFLLKTLSQNLFLTSSYNVQKKLLLENIFLNTNYFHKKNIL